MLRKWKTIKSATIFEHPRIVLIEDTVELPDGNTTEYLRFKATHDAVMIICTRSDQVLLQQEYSYPPDEIMYQFPGGKVEAGEDHTEAAKRELIEESGLAAEKLTQVGWFYTDNRRTSAKFFVYTTSDPEVTTKRGGDAEEFIDSQWVAMSEVDKLIAEGKINNYSLLAGWALFKARQP